MHCLIACLNLAAASMHSYELREAFETAWALDLRSKTVFGNIDQRRGSAIENASAVRGKTRARARQPDRERENKR